MTHLQAIQTTNHVLPKFTRILQTPNDLIKNSNVLKSATSTKILWLKNFKKAQPLIDLTTTSLEQLDRITNQ